MGAQHGDLGVLGQARVGALDVDLVRLPALRFEKEAVAVLVPEPVHLVFDGGAVARPTRLDRAVEHGGAVEVGEDDLVGAGGRGDAVAGQLGTPRRLGAEGIDGVAFEEPRRRCVVGAVVEAEGERRWAPRLEGGLLEVDAAGVDARGRPGLQAPEIEAPGVEAVGDAHGWRFPARLSAALPRR